MKGRKIEDDIAIDRNLWSLGIDRRSLAVRILIIKTIIAIIIIIIIIIIEKIKWSDRVTNEEVLERTSI